MAYFAFLPSLVSRGGLRRLYLLWSSPCGRRARAGGGCLHHPSRHPSVGPLPSTWLPGVQRVAADALRVVLATLGKLGQRYSEALFTWQLQPVSLLVAVRIFTSLHDQFLR
jgi:hypothetical protein